MFQKLSIPNLYNLAFGDKNLETGEFDDEIITNNGDLEKVLASVVAAIYDFTSKNPNAWVYIIGSTESRTRLYKIAINKYFEPLTVTLTFLANRVAIGNAIEKVKIIKHLLLIKK